MSANARSISAINVPISSDVSGFEAGVKKASREGQKFAKEQSATLRGLPFGAATGGVSGLAGALSGLARTGGKNLAGLAGGISLVGAGMAGLAVAAIAAGKAIATGGFNRIGELGKDAVEIGATAEELSRLRNVARATGTDFKDLAAFSSGLTAKINEAIGRADLGAASFGKLGTSAEALAKLPVGEQLRVLNKGFAALPNDAEKARTAMALAGQVGLKNFRLLTLGVDEFEKAYRDGLVTTDDDVSEVKKLETALGKVTDTVEKLSNMFSATLAPVITRVADLAEGFAKRFGVAVAATRPAASMAAPAASPARAVASDAAAAASARVQADMADRRAAADKAAARVAELQNRANKQAADLRKNPGRLFQAPTTNGMGVRVRSTRQKAIDSHAGTNVELAQARATAQRLRDESLSPAEALAQAARLKQVADEVGRLKAENSQTIRTSGQDEIHRRVDTIKGISPADRKSLINQGYQAREADRTSSLRDEVQESTKLPQQKLSEDLNRIGRLVQLGQANGGLSKAQGIRAAAQKTAESGLGGPAQLAGALDSRSAEGRSYLLRQFGKTEDPTALARQGLTLTGQTNNLLGQILGVARSGGGATLMAR